MRRRFDGADHRAAHQPKGPALPQSPSGTARANRLSPRAPSLEASPLLALEQAEQGAVVRVGDRQRLHAELLLGLQSGQVGAFLRHVRVHQVADARGQGVGLGLHKRELAV